MRSYKWVTKRYRWSVNAFRVCEFPLIYLSDPMGIRTPVYGVKGRCPNRLNDGAVQHWDPLAGPDVAACVAKPGLRVKEKTQPRGENVQPPRSSFSFPFSPFRVFRGKNSSSFLLFSFSFSSSSSFSSITAGAGPSAAWPGSPAGRAPGASCAGARARGRDRTAARGRSRARAGANGAGRRRDRR